MGYVIAAILVLLLVAGFVTFLVLQSMRKGSAASSDAGGPGVGADRTPLGDTTEHAGEQTEAGTTASDPEGSAGETGGFDPATPENGQSDVAQGAPRPESERLANPPR